MHRDHRARPADPIGHRISAVVGSMTLAEKAGQMAQAEFGSISPDEVATWSIGSVMSGGGGNPGDGTVVAWRDHVQAYVDASLRSRLGIPILYGTDAVHGHNNVLGATIFPHNIGMGATRDVELVRAVARAGALETAATGARWSFAPCLAVPQDPRWGRTYEGFSQDPELVAEMGAAAVRGWHGDEPASTGVLACAKHYVGEGATAWGSAGSHRHPWIDWWDGWGSGWQIDQGDVRIDEAELRRVHLPPFTAAVRAGALSVMSCYCSWHDRRLHAHRYLLTDVLKGELGFGGFVVSDWMAVDQVDPDYGTAVERCVAAGVDMVMVPFDFRRFVTTIVDLVETGRLAVERIDDAVARILRAKAWIGLLDGVVDRPPPLEPGVPIDPPVTIDPPVPIDVVGCDVHRTLARTAAAASAVVLTNDGALPIPHDATVLTAGEAIDDVGIACGGWTISWEGSAGAVTAGRTVLQGLRSHPGGLVAHDAHGHVGETRADVGVVTIHELPYVEGGGDRVDLSVPPEQIDVVRRIRDRVDRLVLVVISGRPLLLGEVSEHADAIVAAWLPGSQADGVADVLLGRVASTGMLPVRWPRTEAQVSGSADGAVPPLPVGHGIELAPVAEPPVADRPS